MATHRSEFAVPVAEFAAALLARPEVGPRSQVTAEQVAQLLPGTAVVVYVIEDQGNPSWIPKATAGGITVAGGMEFNTGTLGTVAETREFAQFEASRSGAGRLRAPRYPAHRHLSRLYAPAGR